MATYKQSGVDIAAGELSSKIAYNAAKETFSARKGMFGKPVILEGGFSGALDFGDFYLVQNCDGVGSKVAVADAIGKYNTLGYDLLAMVTDDAVCVGAETVSITNTIDTEKVNPEVVSEMMKGLKKACKEQKVVVPGGEIAELPGLIIGNSWNSTAVGVIEKKKFITGKGVKPGDKILGLRSRGFRSNGFSLVRYVLKKAYGEKWFNKAYKDKKTWGEAVLTPALIYSGALLDLLGRYGKKRACNIKALAHVTGGGIPGNITRVLGNYGANLDNLPKPNPMMLELQKLGKIADPEAYKTWNMGVGMIVISKEIDKITAVMKKHRIKVDVIGEVTKEKEIRLISRGAMQAGKELLF